MYCSNCGSNISDTAKFCYSCGTIVELHTSADESIADTSTSPGVPTYQGSSGTRLIFMAESADTGRGLFSWDPSTSDLEQLTSDTVHGKNHVFLGTLGFYGPPIIHQTPLGDNLQIEEKWFVLYSDGSIMDLSEDGFDLGRFDKQSATPGGMIDHESQNGGVYYDQRTGRFFFTISGTRNGDNFNEVMVASGGIYSKLRVPHEEDLYILQGYSPSGKIMLYSIDYDSYLVDPSTLEISLDMEVVKPARHIAGCEPSGQCFELVGPYIYSTKIHASDGEPKYFLAKPTKFCTFPFSKTKVIPRLHPVMRSVMLP